MTDHSFGGEKETLPRIVAHLVTVLFETTFTKMYLLDLKQVHFTLFNLFSGMENRSDLWCYGEVTSYAKSRLVYCVIIQVLNI